MRKNKLTPTERKSALKRATKRSVRLKKTQSQKNKIKMAIIEEKKKIQKKENEEIMKILKSRSNESGDFLQRNKIPVTFAQAVYAAFGKKRLKSKKAIS